MSDAQRIAQLKAELAAVRAQMQELTYTVSHDLRAPLRHVVSFAQLVQAEAGPALDGELRGFLDTMVDSAKHMGLLLDGLLAVSRVDTSPIHMSPLALADVVLEVQALLEPAYGHIRVEWTVAPDFPVVQGDAALLRTALTQVLDNALKFSITSARAGTEPVRIALGWQRTVNEQSAECIALTVRDFGTGYDPAQQGALFQVFGRLSNAKRVAGVGVGLVIARKALARMGGVVDLACHPAGGCVATLQLVQAG